jgi:hypothetical protein
MANPDAPFGFRVVGSMAGGTPGRTNRYRIASAYASNIFSGDMVSLAADGTVIVGTNAVVPLGVFRGCEYVLADGSVRYSKYWPASQATLSGSDRWALIEDDPLARLEVQSDSTLALADIGQYVNLDASSSGSTATGQSAQQIVYAAGAETQFRLVDIVLDRPIRNAAGNQDVLAVGANAVAIVSYVTHNYGKTVGAEI